VPTYFHLDLDAFFVSVEELFDPSLKGKAVVVGGKADERGVVSAASYEARKFGVHSALPLRTAYKLCPHAIFLEGHPDRYRDYSARARAVMQRFTPQLEMASIDEAYMDMTGTERLHGPPLRAAHALHQAMKQETQLNCSIGVASSRLVAKVCSDQAKPNGVLYILPGAEQAYLRGLDVRKIPGVGKVTEQSLREIGIRTVGDLARLDDKFLADRFGEWGLALAGKARGHDAGGWFDSPIGEDDAPKSISHEHTFSVDTADRDQLESTLARLSEMVGRRLREAHLHAANIAIKLRYSDFTTLTRQCTLDSRTQLDPEIYSAVRELFRANWSGARVRLLGVRAAHFGEDEGQLDLLGHSTHDKWDRALSAADRLRDKFGDDAIGLAGGMKGNFRERTHEAMLRDDSPAQDKKPKSK
jgi:DNA polymerase-4